MHEECRCFLHAHHSYDETQGRCMLPEAATYQGAASSQAEASLNLSLAPTHTALSVLLTHVTTYADCDPPFEKHDKTVSLGCTTALNCVANCCPKGLFEGMLPLLTCPRSFMMYKLSTFINRSALLLSVSTVSTLSHLVTCDSNSNSNSSRQWFSLLHRQCFRAANWPTRQCCCCKQLSWQFAAANICFGGGAAASIQSPETLGNAAAASINGSC